MVCGCVFSCLYRKLMADPNPKRAKMDNPNGSSGISRPEDRKIQPKGVLIDTGTQDFDVIRNMRGFVDHTHFIQSFLVGGYSKSAIFAPRRFGKSSHLNMVKMFLQIHVDEITGEASSSVNGPAKGRNNYKIFDGTRIITDDRHKNLVEDHLGKHPVIHLEFKAASIDSVEEASMQYRRAVHRAYLEHSYLKTSTKLVPESESFNASSQNICKKWCDVEQFQTQYLYDSLEKLTTCLYNHFNGAKVYILVDEFDAIHASALRGIRGNTDDTVRKVEHICDILAHLLGSVTKGYDKYVAGALITGVISYIHIPLGSAVLNNISVNRFLDGTNISARFYGATREEVRSLIQKLVQDKELVKFEGKEEFFNDTNELDADKIMADVQSHYNGYFDERGSQIFCLWSALQYLQSGKARNYWSESDGNEDLFKIFKCGYLARKIMELMRWEEIWLSRRRMTINHLVELHDLMQTGNVGTVLPEALFNFLIDQGYLSYLEGKCQGKKFKLPNAEIRAALSNMITNIVEKFWKISTTSCTRLIEDISLSLMKNEKLLQDWMLLVYKAISEMLRPLEQKNHTLMNEFRILCVMYKTFDDAKSFELGFDLGIKDAEGKSMKLDRPDFLLLHKDDKKCSILWELRYKEDSTKDKHTTSLYALQEVRGNVDPRSGGKTKQYMNSLEKLGREALVIGLSVDSDIKVSLSYSLGMEEKIFFMSETEHILHPDLYKTHNLVLLKEENDD